MGRPVDRFLPLKVPLGARFDGAITPEHRFNIDAALAAAYQAVAGMEMEKASVDDQGNPVLKRVPVVLGMVVDLTRSTRYYDPKQWLEAGVKYVKVGAGGVLLAGVQPGWGWQTAGRRGIWRRASVAARHMPRCRLCRPTPRRHTRAARRSHARVAARRRSPRL